MKALQMPVIVLVFVVSVLSGCANETRKSPDESVNIRKSLDQAGLQNVRVSQDRDKGVVTLSGGVPSEDDKMRATTIAKSVAPGEVVSAEIAVVPPGDSDAKTVNSDLDKGIEKNLDAALTQNRLNKGVKYDVKNGVVTLTGEVNSSTRRAEAQKVAASVPNVQQVVNKLDLKNQKATSSN
jgi:osmotically-inducible protein OsmY